ncbi:MAG: ATP-binding protein [Anaerolineae bacterium]|nr:ATP-binding protein [Anaerolineae bacterium]
MSQNLFPNTVFFTATFAAEVEQLAAIGTFVTQAAEAAGFDDRIVYAVQMAVDEACTNIIEYAYRDCENGEIVITCGYDDRGLTITLHDQGTGFSPECVPHPDLSANIDDRAIGGLGIYFIYKLMDEVYYHSSSDRGNTLTLVKYTHPKGA